MAQPTNSSSDANNNSAVIELNNKGHDDALLNNNKENKTVVNPPDDTYNRTSRLSTNEDGNKEISNINPHVADDKSIMLSDCIIPPQLIINAINIGDRKCKVPYHIRLTKAFLAGGYLSLASSVVIVAEAKNDWDATSAALLFPVGFVMLVLMDLDLETGSVAVVPMAYLNNKISFAQLAINWLCVFTGNALGCIFYGTLFYCITTNFGSTKNYANYSAIQQKFIDIGTLKVNDYHKDGVNGWFSCLLKGVLANWMVTMGVFMNILSSKFVISKIFAMWMPIFIFFSLGFEHSVVNMFVLYTGLIWKNDATYTFQEWWAYNQIPTIIGNILGGFLLTTFLYHHIYRYKP